MKKNLLNKILFSGCMLFAAVSYGQSPESAHGQSSSVHSTYAVTDSVRNGIKWNLLRTLNTETGSYSAPLTRLLSNSELQSPEPAIIPCNGVAAIAYDKENKRVYYTAMLSDKLGYIDLKTMKNYVVTNRFTGLMPKTNDQVSIVTRMVIGEDDKGYALTNDGKHLIRFRTGKNNPSITDLGSLIDAPGNNEISIHNGCSSFGGDIIADDDDNLYLFTFGKHVFKIDTRTRIAKYIGTIKGLPENFPISGASVDKSREKVVLVSSVDSSGVYTLDIKTLAAKKIRNSDTWHTSDLASGYVLKDKKNHRDFDDMIVMNDETNNDNIRLFPNPVTAKEFKLAFDDVTPGTYNVTVMGAGGELITSKQVIVGGKDNTVLVRLPGSTTSGIYIVRVTSGDKTWYSGKIFVQ